MNTNKKIAVEWLPIAGAMPDDSTLVLIALNDDDVWTGYRDGDIWRYSDAMPIEKERVTHWARMPDPPTEESEAPPVALLPLDEQTRIILGRPNFACIRTAQRMRELGHRIPRKAGEEQAAVIHLHLTMYQKHGAAWLEHANLYLEHGPSTVAPTPQQAAA
jgi:hypothetical protein